MLAWTADDLNEILCKRFNLVVVTTDRNMRFLFFGKRAQLYSWFAYVETDQLILYHGR